MKARRIICSVCEEIVALVDSEDVECNRFVPCPYGGDGDKPCNLRQERGKCGGCQTATINPRESQDTESQALGTAGTTDTIPQGSGAR